MGLRRIRVLGFGGLAVQESRHLHQPGWLESGDEPCGARTTEAGPREAGGVGGPRSQGVMVSEKLTKGLLTLGQVGAVDPMLLERSQPETAFARHLLLGFSRAGPRTARRLELAAEAQTGRRVALEHTRTDLT